MDITGRTKEGLVNIYINKTKDKDLKTDIQKKYQNQTKNKKLQLKAIRNAI